MGLLTIFGQVTLIMHKTECCWLKLMQDDLVKNKPGIMQDIVNAPIAPINLGSAVANFNVCVWLSSSLGFRTSGPLRPNNNLNSLGGKTAISLFLNILHEYLNISVLGQLFLLYEMC